MYKISGIFLGFVGLAYASQLVQAQDVRVTFDKRAVKVKNGKIFIGKNTYARAELVKQLSKQLARVNRGIKRTNSQALPFTSINVTDACTATVTCGNGKPITCSLPGPGACESGQLSVACISPVPGQTTHESCPPNPSPS